MTQTKSAKGTGRRKSSIARVRLMTGTGQMTINRLTDGKYIQNNESLIQIIKAPLTFLNLEKQIDLIINITGGGRIGQANAIQLGIARALCNFNLDYRTPLKRKGFLTRDARVKERKKYGLKKARKAPQYSKR